MFSSELTRSYSAVDQSVHLMKGDITDFHLHHCDAIVNAANMEVLFGGGISGAIASATQDRIAIDKVASAAIKSFWTEYKKVR